MTATRSALLIALITTACTSEPAANTDSLAIVARGTAQSTGGVNEPADSAPPTTGTNPPARNLTPAPWTVNEFGIGPLRAGMTVPEAARIVGGSFAARTGGEGNNCTYAVWREAPDGVLVMLVNGLVARVDVTKGSIATSAGARIGDSEARIKDLYRNRVVVKPHEYTDGHYLTVSPAPATGEDRSYGLVFETDGNRVLRYRGGKQPMVGWVEGCS
jgi:hypothetical protein